ncbi:MAG: DUF1109 domain-containing protein [Steroidobacterales bacterium]
MQKRFAIATGAGVPVSAALLLALLHVRGDLATAMMLPLFWFKAGFAAIMVCAGAAITAKLARPGARLGAGPAAAGLAILAVWLVALVALAHAEPSQRLTLMLGHTWLVCPWLIAMLSAPLLAANLWAMRGLAPTRLRMAGFACGLSAGALAALVYCLHCPEMAPPFIAIWYVLGIFVPAAIGALVGPRLLRW